MSIGLPKIKRDHSNLCSGLQLRSDNVICQITSSRQFQQRFTRAFFVRNFGAENALSYEKHAREMLMKLTPAMKKEVYTYRGNTCVCVCVCVCE